MSTALPDRPARPAHQRRFAIVSSRYNPVYVEGLVENALREIEASAPGSTVEHWQVPGAFEIPLLVQEVARLGRHDAILALGVIIEGSTQHAALIGGTLTTSLQRISLEQRIPVIHEVLLVKSEEQARERCLEPKLNRGVEAARVAVQMAEVMAGFERP
jgi:6,7-dimethyl-8-ribityllumazine synthase